MPLHLLSTQEFYSAVARYHQRLLDGTDPAWQQTEQQHAEQERQLGLAHERAALRAHFGEGNGRTALDASCGDGQQAIPLAQLGWRVTATDLTDLQLDLARARAAREGVTLTVQSCDLRDLDQQFQEQFDLAITCMALDNLPTDGAIRRALRGLFGALRPGGRCYIRLRDLEHVVAERQRYEWKGERTLPYGRLISLEDWQYEGEPEVTHVVHIYAYLLEDHRREGYQWDSTAYGHRRRVLRKAELDQFLRDEGFGHVEFLPQPSRWSPYEVIATKG